MPTRRTRSLCWARAASGYATTAPANRVRNARRGKSPLPAAREEVGLRSNPGEGALPPIRARRIRPLTPTLSPHAGRGRDLSRRLTRSPRRLLSSLDLRNLCVRNELFEERHVLGDALLHRVGTAGDRRIAELDDAVFDVVL